MSSEWVRVKIEDACELIVDCVNKTAPTVDYITPYRMIRTPHIKNGRICLTDEKFVDKETYEKWVRRAKLQVGDVLLTREAPLGSVGMIREEDTLFLGQRIVQYRANKEVLDPGFLLYSFLAPDLQAQFHSYGGTGSTVDHIRVPDCVRFEISLPPLREQKAIAHILGTLDDKIELNRKTNETLEAMAKALFKSWFVDFDPVRAKAEGRPTGLPADISDLFPDSFEDSELGEIPAGWKATSLGDIATVLMGQSPSGDSCSMDPAGPPLLNGPTEFGEFFPAPVQFTCDPQKEAKAGDLLFCVRGSTTGRMNWADQAYAIGRGLASIRPKDIDHPLMIRISMERFLSDLLAKATGSTFPNVSRSDIESTPLVLPGDAVRTRFLVECRSIYECMASHSMEIQTLANIRDTLLPKLISGELRIPDAEKLLKEILS